MQKFKVYELDVKVYLLQNIHDDILLTAESDFIDSALAKDYEWLLFHKTNKYKQYTFDKLNPFMKNAVYKKDNVYTLKIRSVNTALIKFLFDILKDHHNSYFKGLTTEIKVIPQRPIQDLYTLTPMIQKYKSGYWRGQESVDSFENNLIVNAIKKYNDFTGEKIDENFEFYQLIKFQNKYPIANKYKEITLLGDKVHLYISSNQTAQNLAYFLSGVGLGENCSRGYGFCNFDWM